MTILKRIRIISLLTISLISFQRIFSDSLSLKRIRIKDVLRIFKDKDKDKDYLTI